MASPTQEGRSPGGPAPLDRRLAALLLLCAALFLFARLGARDLWAPDEPRYAQIAEEVRSGEHGGAGWVLLHLNGEVYTQKPPLYYWLAAALGVPTGRVSETAARLPSAAAGVATIALTLALGSRLVGGPSALVGTSLLLTANLFAELGRRAQLDMLLTLFELMALICFWRLDRGIGRRRINVAGLHAAMGLAVMTKGPVGVLVPLLVIVGFLALDRRLGDLRRMAAPWAWILSLGPGLAWVSSAALLAPPGYLDDAVGSNLFGRFFSGTSHERPFYYFLYQFPVDFLPWTLCWPLVWVVARRTVFTASGHEEQRRSWRFLLVWVAASVAFFSLSSGKRGLYMLPAFPAAALLCGAAISAFLAERPRMPAAGHVVAGLLALLLLGAGAALAAGAVPLALPPALGFALLASCLIAIGVWLGLSRARVRPMAQVALAIAGVFLVEFAVLVFVYPILDPEKSPAPIAAAAAELTPPGGAVGLVSDRALVGGLAYYGGRRVEPLEDPDAIRAFIERGAGPIVVKERKLPRIEAVAPVDVRFRARSGRRTIVVVTPRVEESS